MKENRSKFYYCNVEFWSNDGLMTTWSNDAASNTTHLMSLPNELSFFNNSKDNYLSCSNVFPGTIIGDITSFFDRFLQQAQNIIRYEQHEPHLMSKMFPP